MALAACSSSGGTGTHSSASSSSGGGEIKAGLLSDVTGALASGHDAEDGVKARFAVQNAEGGVDGKKLAYVKVDTTSTVPGALSAAQTLVQNDNVIGVLAGTLSPVGAVNYLKAQKVPLIGYGSTAAQFGDSSFSNMFSISGSSDPKFLVTTTYGKFFKSQGVTKLAGVAYATATGANGLKATLQGAAAVGVPTAYQNTNVPIGTTDVGSLALAIKDSGADGIYLSVLPTTAIPLLAKLKEDGVNLKAAMMIVGYGQDILDSAPATAALQGVYFSTFIQPAESRTPATKQMIDALHKYTGATKQPYTMDYLGWIEADMFIKGLQAAGPNLTRSGFISALRKVTDYTAGGLYGKPLDLSQFGNQGISVGPGNCMYAAKLVGQQFQVVPSADPVCGESTGKTVD